MTSRRGIQSCQAAATKIGSGDPGPRGTRVDAQRRFIIAFAEFINGYLLLRAVRCPKVLKRLHHDQNNDQNHQPCRNLIQNTIESSGSVIGVGGEGAHAACKIPV